jgi:hypothetical protein
MRARFAQGLAMQIGHLVGANHHRMWMLLRNRTRLCQRQTLCERERRFVLPRGFVHFGGDHIKGNTQTLQQLAAVARGRAQNQVC